MSRPDRVLKSKGATTGGGGGIGGKDPQHFYWPPILYRAFNLGDRFNSFVWNVFLCFVWKVNFFKISLSTNTPDRTILSSKFHEPLPQSLPRSFSNFDLDSGFALISRGLRALDSGFARFGPPNFWSVVAPLLKSRNPCRDSVYRCVQPKSMQLIAPSFYFTIISTANIHAQFNCSAIQPIVSVYRRFQGFAIWLNSIQHYMILSWWPCHDIKTCQFTCPFT